MPDNISLTGVVATDPRHITTSEGLEITSFRLASSQRRFDKGSNSWIETGTNWYTVTAFRQLAANVASSVSRGDRVIASGRLRLREWSNADKSGATMEVDAESVGHDLAWGTAAFVKSSAQHGHAGGADARPAGGATDAAGGWPSTPGDSSAAPTDAGGWGLPGASSAGTGADGFLPAAREPEPVGAE